MQCEEENAEKRERRKKHEDEIEKMRGNPAGKKGCTTSILWSN